MILTCPECATSYFVPDEAMSPTGRRVRCQSCAHTWRATAEEPLELTASAVKTPPPVAAASAPVAAAAGFGKRDEAVAESLAETPAPELPRAYRARAEQQRRLRRAAAHGVVWAGLASGFAALMAAGWLFRVDVVEMYPRAAAAYALVGSPVNPVGLEFEAVTARPARDHPGMVLVSGALRNVRDNEVVAPAIRVALLDAAGAEIGHQVVRIEAAPVLPGKVMGFAALAPDPRSRAADVGVSLLTEAPEAPSLDVEPTRHARARPSAPAHGLRPAMEAEAVALPPQEPVDARPIDIAA